MSKRWIPRIGERVTLAGDSRSDLPSWNGIVTHVCKNGCHPGEVYLYLDGHGFTHASKHEITIMGVQS